MPKTRRRRTDREQFWGETIAAWKSSEQSVRAFCAARGVSEARFFVRRRQLDGPGHSDQPASPIPRPTFVPVRVVPEPTVEIVLTTGVVIRVPVGPDSAAVARLAAALGGASC
jgi:hypothetical protein